MASTRHALAALCAAGLLAAACGSGRSVPRSVAPGPWPCTAAAFHACSPASDPGWDEYNNPWHKPPMPPNAYTLFARNHADWEVVARQAPCPTADCAVEAYESAQYDWDNAAGKETIADATLLTSTFDQTMPTGNLRSDGFDAEAAYDIWLNDYRLEVMIWVDNQGQTPAGTRIGTAELSPGAPYAVYRGGTTYSFLAASNATSGTVDILAALDWLVAHHDAAASSYLTQFNFGWEICSTDGRTDTFRLRGLELQQAFR